MGSIIKYCLFLKNQTSRLIHPPEYYNYLRTGQLLIVQY